MIILALVLVGIFCLWPRSISHTPSSRVLVTSAHLKAIDGYKLVHTDEENDYAVFYKLSYDASTLPPNAHVRAGGYEAVLTETTSTTFTALLVTAPDTSILPGTVVTYNEEPVGFVTSGSTQNLLCHYY